MEGPDVEFLPRRVEGAATFELPWRTYELFEGPIEGATCFRTSRFQSPNLWWPQDRSWCVASEIDLPWTYIAGPRELVGDVLAATRLEALVASPDDPIVGALPEWLDRRIDAAVDDVIDTGSTTLTFAPFTVTVTLTLGRKEFVLMSRTERRCGWGSATRFIQSRDSEAIRREVRLAIEGAVVNHA